MAAIFKANWGPLVPRFLLGLVFLFHGGQKLFGLFGGDGLAGLEQAVAGWGWPAPGVFARGVAVTEFFGGACLLLGLLTRFWSAALAGIMIVAAVKVHGSSGFSIDRHVEGIHGWEYNFVLAVLALSLAVQGGGAFSLDEMFFRGRRKPAKPKPGSP